MRIHLVAMMALLTAAVVTGCDSAREVRDTGRVSAYGCDSCHGYPPPPSFNPEAIHPVGVTASSCVLCHPSSVHADGHTIVADGTHRNGQTEVVEGWAAPRCDGCHATPPDTGEHRFHTVTAGLDCATCHRGFAIGDELTRTADASVHMNGNVDVILPGGTVIPAAGLPDGSWPDSQCLACHSALED